MPAHAQRSAVSPSRCIPLHRAPAFLLLQEGSHRSIGTTPLLARSPWIFTKAHKSVLVREDERGMRLFRHSARLYLYKVCHFGLKARVHEGHGTEHVCMAGSCDGPRQSQPCRQFLCLLSVSAWSARLPLHAALMEQCRCILVWVSYVTEAAETRAERCGSLFLLPSVLRIVAMRESMTMMYSCKIGG